MSMGLTSMTGILKDQKVCLILGTKREKFEGLFTYIVLYAHMLSVCTKFIFEKLSKTTKLEVLNGKKLLIKYSLHRHI